MRVKIKHEDRAFLFNRVQTSKRRRKGRKRHDSKEKGRTWKDESLAKNFSLSFSFSLIPSPFSHSFFSVSPQNFVTSVPVTRRLVLREFPSAGKSLTVNTFLLVLPPFPPLPIFLFSPFLSAKRPRRMCIFGSRALRVEFQRLNIPPRLGRNSVRASAKEARPSSRRLFVCGNSRSRSFLF